MTLVTLKRVKINPYFTSVTVPTYIETVFVLFRERMFALFSSKKSMRQTIFAYEVLCNSTLAVTYT